MYLLPPGIRPLEVSMLGGGPVVCSVHAGRGTWLETTRHMPAVARGLRQPGKYRNPPNLTPASE